MVRYFLMVFGLIKATGRWAWRNKVPIGITTAVIGGGVYYGYYKVIGMLEEQLSSQLLSQFPQQDKKDSFFDAIDFRSTVRREFDLLKKTLNEIIPKPTEEEMRASKSLPKEEKEQFVEQLKILNFTRLFTVVYAQVLFSLSMHVHLSILSRYIYFSVLQQDENKNSAFEIENETRVKFLSQAKYVLENGMNHLRNQIECAVEATFADVSIRTAISSTELINLIQNVREDIEGNNIGTLIRHVLPVEQKSTSEENEEGNIRLLENEVRNVFESEEFLHGLKNSCDIAFQQLDFAFQGVYQSRAEKQNKDVNDFRIHVALLAGAIASTTSSLQDENNEIVSATFRNAVIEQLARRIYNLEI